MDLPLPKIIAHQLKNAITVCCVRATRKLFSSFRSCEVRDQKSVSRVKVSHVQWLGIAAQRGINFQVHAHAELVLAAHLLGPHPPPRERERESESHAVKWKNALACFGHSLRGRGTLPTCGIGKCCRFVTGVREESFPFGGADASSNNRHTHRRTLTTTTMATLIASPRSLPGTFLEYVCGVRAKHVILCKHICFTLILK